MPRNFDLMSTAMWRDLGHFLTMDVTISKRVLLWFLGKKLGLDVGPAAELEILSKSLQLACKQDKKAAHAQRKPRRGVPF